MEAVSSESEKLITVDSDDRELGTITKAAAHDGKGVLHRAFSIFIFNSQGELLLQQRSAEKRLWPLYWSNTCCSHPRAGEDMPTATVRRLEQELGMTTRLTYLFKFEYQAHFGAAGSEHELCSVYVGQSDATPRSHPMEIAGLKWLSVEAVTRELASDPEGQRYTPWFKIEWQRLLGEHTEIMKALTTPAT
ncbi:MAG: isopentenyl-diphosphate Delta-isomerase [Myxococcota bacterium]|nr:isopentenyl-diphosphate Delta-isomerase [Myxococcota bacterium]